MSTYDSQTSEVIQVSDVERTIEDAQRFHHVSPGQLRVVCAWCQDYDLLNPANRNASHGICSSCAAKLLRPVSSEESAHM